MTNEQTRILLKSIRNRVLQAAEDAERLMPEDAKKLASNQLYQIEIFAALEPFEILLRSLDEDIDILSKPTREQGK